MKAYRVKVNTNRPDIFNIRDSENMILEQHPAENHRIIVITDNPEKIFSAFGKILEITLLEPVYIL